MVKRSLDKAIPAATLSVEDAATAADAELDSPALRLAGVLQGAASVADVAALPPPLVVFEFPGSVKASVCVPTTIAEEPTETVAPLIVTAGSP